MPAVASLLKPRRTLSALLGSALLSAVVAVPLLASPSADAAVKQTPGLTPGHTLSGVIHHLGPNFTSTFAAYRNAPITAVVAYGGTDSWSSITAMGSIGWWQQVPVHHVWSMPLIPSDGSSSIAAAGAGSYDSKWVTVAQKLVAGGDANATIRLGWEMTGDWFAWNGIKNPTAWASGYRHAVTAMRSVAGAHFTFDWDPALLMADPTQMWPGDSYVDIVSADTYDTSWASSYAASNHTAVWNEILNGKFGWNWLLNFNAQHGNKPIALPEWGLHYMCNGHGGGDDVNFIDQVHKFIQTHNVAYENYFDANDSSCSRFIMNDSDFPKAAAEYRKLWAGNGTITPIGTPTTTPPTTQPPTTPPTTQPPTTPPTTAPPTTAPPTTAPPTTAPPDHGVPDASWRRHRVSDDVQLVAQPVLAGGTGQAHLRPQHLPLLPGRRRCEEGRLLLGRRDAQHRHRRSLGLRRHPGAGPADAHLRLAHRAGHRDDEQRHHGQVFGDDHRPVDGRDQARGYRHPAAGHHDAGAGHHDSAAGGQRRRTACGSATRPTCPGRWTCPG